MAQLLAQRLGLLTHVTGARVLGAVDAVAEAHDAVLGVQALADVLLGVLRLANLFRHFLHGLGGAAVQRALEGADGGDDVAVQVAERARR